MTMGLDQYLYASRYFSYGSDEHTPDNRNKKNQCAAICKAAGFDMVKPFTGMSVEVEIGYWRKANAIHKWMVDNVQGGEDNCARYCLSIQQLDELLKICNDILAEQDKEKQVKLAEDTLPPQSGFFFGCTAIDDDYMNDLKRTIEIINKAKKISKDSWFYYTSSW
jgi:hypothetical protein